MIDSRIKIHLLRDGTGAATAEEYTVYCIPTVGIPHQSEKTKRQKDNNSNNNNNNNYQIEYIYLQAVDQRCIHFDCNLEVFFMEQDSWQMQTR